MSGGAKRDRTADLLRATQALSQLSYSPEIFQYSEGDAIMPRFLSSLNLWRNITDSVIDARQDMLLAN